MKLNKPTRTVVELAPEQEERVTFNATPRVEAPVVAEPEAIPQLVQTRGPELGKGESMYDLVEEMPPLQEVRRQMRRIELPPAPVQSSAETDAEADSAFADMGIDEEEQETIQQELADEQANSHPQLQRVSRRQVVQLGQSDNGATGTNDVAEESGDTGAVVEAAEPPPLQRVVREPEVVPPLQLIRDGSRIEGEIPQLTAYNKMEVAHLLIGKAADDDEVYLLSSFSARTLASKKPEELNDILYRTVCNHANRLAVDGFEDFAERRAQRTVSVLTVNEAQKARGTQWAAALVDGGGPNQNDHTAIVSELEQSGEEYDDKDIEALSMERGFTYENSYVFTWALVKVKIGQDFGNFKLSSLMPAL